MDEPQQPQLEHKNLPRDVKFFDKHGQQVTYKINHEDSSDEHCNDFYPIRCQRGKDQKILRLLNDGENFALISISTDFTTPSVWLSVDCFRMGKTLNQFRRSCRSPSPASLSPSESSIGTYNPISPVEGARTKEPGVFSLVEHLPHEIENDDVDEDSYFCKVNANDNYCFRKTRTAHDYVPGN